MTRINAVALGAAMLIGMAGVAGAQNPQTPKQGVAPRTDHRGMGQHGRRGFGGRSGARFGGRLAKDLNLTDAQKAQVKTIHQKYQPQFQALRTQMQAQMKAQRDNISALRQKGDTAGARAARQKAFGDFGQRVAAIRQQEQTEIRNILTAEQRTKFDAAQAETKKRMEERAKNGGLDGRRIFNRGPRAQRG